MISRLRFKNWILIALAFLYINKLHAQDTAAIPSIRFSTNPLHFIDLYNGNRWNIEAEFHLKNNLTTSVYFGEIFSFINWTGLNNHTGYSLESSIKKYYKDDLGGHSYWTVVLAHGEQSFTRTDLIEIPGNSPFYPDTSYIKTYHTDRKITGVSGKFGHQTQYKSGLSLEGFFGFGLRWNIVGNDLTDLESEYRVLGDWTVPWNWLIKKGENLIPVFHLGFKIGWKIK